jgi:UTP--glucose-1-phosphate uridylyltransferase
VAVLEVPREDIRNYGCVTPEGVEENLVRVRSIVEKPKPEEAPSNLAVIGRYVFTPEIFDALDRITPGAGGELQLTDAIGLLLQTQTVFGYTFESGRYDIGKKIDFLRATSSRRSWPTSCSGARSSDVPGAAGRHDAGGTTGDGLVPPTSGGQSS